MRRALWLFVTACTTPAAPCPRQGIVTDTTRVTGVVSATITYTRWTCDTLRRDTLVVVRPPAP
jgi:hypothetical protein